MCSNQAVSVIQRNILNLFAVRSGIKRVLARAAFSHCAAAAAECVINMHNAYHTRKLFI